MIEDPIPDELAPGVYRLRSAQATWWVREQLERAGWAVGVVDLADAPDKPAILDAFATALGFPAWSGRNWDALSDSLRDLAWWPAGPRGRVVIVRGPGREDTGTERDRAVLHGILGEATAWWRDTASPLVVLLRR